jgi:VanZ family protein
MLHLLYTRPMSKFDKSLFYYKLPPVLYAAMIIAVSTMSHVSPPSFGVTWTDKIYHFGEYFVYAILIFRAFPNVHQSPSRKLLYTFLFLFGLAYGAIDERVQYYIPNRDSSPYDWMADAVGYLTAGTLFLFWRIWSVRRLEAKE